MPNSPAASASTLPRDVVPGQISPWPAVRSLCWREIIRFVRQRNRLIGAFAQPIVFWLLFGVGLHKSFRMGDGQDSTSFMAYYFPGTLMLILLFTAIFATISIIEDRKEGFLQGVLISPVPSWAIVLGKVLGGALIATAQGMVFLALGYFVGAGADIANLLAVIPLMLLTAITMTSLGFVIAWRMESTQGFHAIMNLVLMPMWLLSGAFFPIPAASGETAWGQLALHWTMRLNPLTYGVSGARRLLFPVATSDGFWLPSLSTSWLLSFVFAALIFSTAWRISAKRIGGDHV